MLKDNIDFNYAIKFLKNDLDLNIELQDDIMESKKMNNSLKSIEDNLNVLYEKTRFLEDSIDYAKTFLTIKIDNYIKDLNSSLKSIEDISNINKNLGYIDYNVPFIENTIDIKDRNKNYKITPCSLMNNKLNLSNRIKDSFLPSSIKMKCEQKPHINNINSFCNTDSIYRSIYLEEKPIEEGIIETITMYLKEPTEINQLIIKPVNCNIKNIRYVYINGIEENSGDLVTGTELESRVVTHIKFDIECKNYNIIQYTIDKNKAATDTLWNRLKELEYPTSSNVDDKINYEAIIKKTEYNKQTNKSSVTLYSPEIKDSIQLNMYAYNFGIDLLEINRITLYEDNYFLSDSINIDLLNLNEYIQLNVDDHVGENSSIEYYIVDGDRDVPILPIGIDFIKNERIFPETELRFIESDSLESFHEKLIKQNGLNIKISLEEAKRKYDARYSVNYTPLITNTYRPLNNTIKIKAIIRTFGDTYDTIPYINMINIRKFGGNALWTNLY